MEVFGNFFNRRKDHKNLKKIRRIAKMIQRLLLFTLKHRFGIKSNMWVYFGHCATIFLKIFKFIKGYVSFLTFPVRKNLFMPI